MVERFLRYRAERAVRREALRRMRRLGWTRDRSRVETYGFLIVMIAAFSLIFGSFFIETGVAHDVVHLLGLERH